jgi:hypothetical protein
MLVFTAASPVELDCQLLAMRNPISPDANYHAPCALKKGKKTAGSAPFQTVAEADAMR